MEHPILFLPMLLQKLGLPVVLDPDEAHTFLQKLLLPHVIHGWLVMILLIGLAWLVSKKLELVPGKGQNVFEVVLTGIEDFMVGIVG
ncbi:MAG: F0F1 ATP synthase subunit A, partial [Thermodesulforhabdaceae bacterium]